MPDGLIFWALHTTQSLSLELPQKNKYWVVLPRNVIGNRALKNSRAGYELPEDRDVDAGADGDDYGPGDINIHNIMDGSTHIDISHAGGEFVATLQDGIEREMANMKKSAPDYRVRDDRTQNLVNGWSVQMERLVKVYMIWCAEADMGPSRERTPRMVEEIEITVVDLYETQRMDVELDAGGAGVAAALIKQGLMPCAPWKPSVAIATRVLELYRTTHIRCPQLAIQSFVKLLCDLHGVPYRPYLRQQFSTAYDIYLEIRRQTDCLVNSALGRNTPNWRLKHTCPACMYKLEGEDELIFSMLFNMDGNDSLKRVLKRLKTDGSEEEPTAGPSIERDDSRDGGEDYFLRWERVDRWGDPSNPCSGRWKNMINDVTSKMWGIFDETGIFLALCRHGFALVVADMVRSGELSKYPLAVVEVLLDTFGLKLGGGYDIGCHFESTLKNSELGDKARTNRFKSLVGSFHGHAHNRLCQLSFLATYVEGLGLEDLEGCERSVRYASKFHRRQEITTFMKQIDDLEVYANLSKFLCDNYQQALKILQTEPALKRWMQEEGVEDYDTFHVWLEEEKEYLLGLDAGLPKKRELTLEMEYLQKLVNLEGSQYVEGNGADYSPAPISHVARRHAIEQRNRDIELVEDLEQKLGVETWWTSDSPQWTATDAALKKHKYLDALDEIEQIILARLFEMTKAIAGYKMRSHIAKALQARSKAIRNAIERYNKVALSMEPPMPTLDWDQILRAREEIQRLNIEIKCVVTWIDNEDRFLRKKEEELKETDPLLAVQVTRYRQRRGRSDLYHMHRFWALAKVPGFTGSVVPGISIEAREARRQARQAQHAMLEGRAMDVDEGDEVDEIVVEERDRWEQERDEGWEDEIEDEGEQAREENIAALMYQMSVLAVDREGMSGVNPGLN
ncbi:hypothetical protein B0H14DRAFT_2638071 [Mycena olivaceomarginata]|nr:hypothetical protein B0H14DRAFT_2638071 [Mycena olivaceomarginata]